MAISRSAGASLLRAPDGQDTPLLGRLDPQSWWAAELLRTPRVRLAGASELELLSRFAHPERVRAMPWAAFWAGRYGPRGWQPAGALSWSTDACELPPDPRLDFHFAALPRSLERAPWIAPPELLAELGATISGLAPDLGAPAPELRRLERAPSCPAWRRPRPALFLGRGVERDRFPLLACDGSIAPEAIDRLSVLARPPGVARPPLPLPAEPAPEAGRGEWLPGVRLVHPRLVWAMQQVANRFPHRGIYLVSGYRPESSGSQHALGRALDIQVMGIAKERVFALCRELEHVACGYYPHHEFIHFDVRDGGARHPMWIDASLPGEPAQYVDAWPGVVDGGALAHQGER